MTLEHEWRETDQRCKHCGTPKAMHEAQAQNCVPRYDPAVALRPEPGLREYAVNDQDAIYAGIVRLREERDAARNYVEEPQT